jgi:hypothetical protein
VANNQIDILANLRVSGALVLDKDFNEFPVNPKIGTLVIKDRCLYGYIKIGDLETWYPFATRTASYIHVQAVPMEIWEVSHNLGSEELWYQIKDPNGNIIYPSEIEYVSPDVVRVKFTEPAIGNALFVAPDAMSVPSLKTTRIEVGSTVVIDTAGMTVDGERVLTRSVLNIGDGTDPKFSVDDTERLDFVQGVGIEIVYDAEAKKLVFSAPGASVTPQYVDDRIAQVTGMAPALMDTLQEIAASLDNNPNFKAWVQTQIDAQVAAEAALRTSGDAVLDAKIGTLSSLDTNAKGSVVASLNELKARSDASDAGIASVNTALGSEVVARDAADAQLGSKIGDTTALATTAKSSLVAALNELYTNLGAEATSRQSGQTTLTNKVGDLSTLSTSTKSSLVGALNEVLTLLSSEVTNRTDADTALSGQIATLQALVSSDDVNLDTVQEIIDTIKANKSLLDSVTVNKLNVSDVVDSLTSNAAAKALSANQGRVLKALIDGLSSAVATEIEARTNAIAAVESQIGVIGNLTTTAKSDLVVAVNEVKADLSSEAASRTSADQAIDAKIGTLASLTTTAKGNLVAALNEVKAAVATEASARAASDTALDNKIGALTALTTSDKTSVVAAVNEAVAGTAAEALARGNAISTVEGHIGVLGNLDTTSKSSIVAAINELRAMLVAHIADTSVHMTTQVSEAIIAQSNVMIVDAQDNVLIDANGA